MIIKKRHKLKQRDINLLCMVYIMEKRADHPRASRNLVDMLLHYKLVNPVKSIYENIRGLLHEHQYRYMTVLGHPIQSAKGGPRTSFDLTPHGFSYVKEFYEASEVFKSIALKKLTDTEDEEYRSPIEGQPLVESSILKDNIGRCFNG